VHKLFVTSNVIDGKASITFTLYL
ncbi:MAG: hypothetical protein RIS09_670, partial [Actinomycetota bacterium]